MIGGTVYINEYNYVEWQANREHIDYAQPHHFIYAVTLDMRDKRGYPRHVTFEVSHLPANGMLVLTSLIMQEANRRIPNG